MPSAVALSKARIIKATHLYLTFGCSVRVPKRADIPRALLKSSIERTTSKGRLQFVLPGTTAQAVCSNIQSYLLNIPQVVDRQSAGTTYCARHVMVSVRYALQRERKANSGDCELVSGL
jgi:hypothetical protein